MNRDMNQRGPGPTQEHPRQGQAPADATPRKIGDDDSLENSSPTDSRSDEKVIANRHQAGSTDNAPWPTAANTREADANDDSI